MFKNYLLLTLRNLGKNSFLVLINLVGLGLALAICITAYFNYKYNADFNTFHENYDNIYKISITKEIQGRQQEYGITTYILGEKVEQDIPQIKEMVCTTRSYSPVKRGEHIYRKSVNYVDDNFFDVFTLTMIKGSQEALKDKGNILINDKLAAVYFGDEDPVGKIIFVFNDNNEETTFMVAGVFEALPLNSSFCFETLTHIDNFTEMWDLDYDQWLYWVGGTWLLVEDETQIPEINEKLKEEWALLIPNYPYEGIYQEELMEEAKQINTNIKQMFVFLGSIACFLSAMRLFTLVSLAIINRTKEIGIRKVMGANVPVIMKIINRPFIIMVTIAVIIGLPVGYYMSMALMDSIWALYTDANVISFLIPIVLIYLILFVTNTYKIYIAALQNPAQSLRYE